MVPKKPCCSVIDKGVNASRPASHWPLYTIPFVLGYILYRAAIGPAIDWGNSVRSSIDLHRLEIYEKLGVRAPISFSDERQLADTPTPEADSYSLGVPERSLARRAQR